MRNKHIFLNIVLSICIVSLNVYPAFAMETGGLPEDHIPAAEKVSDNLGIHGEQAPSKEADTFAGETTLFTLATTPQAIIAMPQAIVATKQSISLGEKPTFQIELTEKEGVSGLYGTLGYIPAKTIEILVLYSFDGDHYYSVENKDEYGFRKWDLTDLQEEAEPQTQLCIDENDSPLKAYLRETVNTLYVKLMITHVVKENSVNTYTEAIKLSHDKTWEAPKLPPNFSAKIELGGQGYQVKGEFADFLPNTVRIRPMYSLDGENYQVICEQQPNDWHLDRLGSEDEAELKLLQKQTCVEASTEPLKSYLAGAIDSFYVRLQITLENGICYDTKPCQIIRNTIQPLPEDATLSALFPGSMRVKNWRPLYTYGKYQITVREDASIESIYAMLPNTIPVEVQIGLNGNSGVPIIANVKTAVSWKAFTDINLKADETLTINDAANDLVIPAGTQLSTPQGIYALSHELIFDGIYSRDNICLVLNVIGKEDKAVVSLYGTKAEEAVENQLPISLAFSNKPSGATAIKTYSYIEGDTGWTALGDLLTQRAIDANQAQQLYGYIDVLRPNASSYQRYLQGEVPGLVIALVIEGGVYAGETVLLPWPYEYDLPIKVPELSGSGGNENNAGSGDNKEKDSSNNGGQRPDLPGNELPPLVSSPPPVFTPAPTPASEPTPKLTPEPTPVSESTPMLTPAPSPASGPTPALTSVLSPASESTPMFTPASTPASEPAPMFTTVSTSVSDPAPLIESPQVLLPMAAPEPVVKAEPIPNSKPAALVMEAQEKSIADHGNNTAVIDPPILDSSIKQQQVMISANTNVTYANLMDNNSTATQPSIEPSKPLGAPQEGLPEKETDRKKFASAEPIVPSTAETTERKVPRRTGFPQAAAVGVLAVGSVATIGIAASAAGTTTSAGVAGKLITILKRLLLRK